MMKHKFIFIVVALGLATVITTYTIKKRQQDPTIINGAKRS